MLILIIQSICIFIIVTQFLLLYGCISKGEGGPIPASITLLFIACFILRSIIS